MCSLGAKLGVGEVESCLRERRGSVLCAQSTRRGLHSPLGFASHTGFKRGQVVVQTGEETVTINYVYINLH